MTKPYLPLIDRSKHSEIGDKAADSLEELVNFGCELLNTIQTQSPGSPFKVVTCLLYREALQCIELLAMAFRNSASDNAQKMLRPLAEIQINLRYLMIQSVIGQREIKSWAFLYVAKQRRLAEIRVSQTGTDAHRQAKAVARREISNTVYQLNEPSLKSEVESIQRELQNPYYSQFDRTWTELCSRGSQPAWYTLAGGPLKFDALASAVALDSLYHRVYRHFVDHSHGMANLVEIDYEIGPSTDPKILPIRSGRYSPLIFGTAQNMAHAISKLMVQAHFIKSDWHIWNDWYESAMKSGLILTEGFIK
jgi:hypothetical protein